MSARNPTSSPRIFITGGASGLGRALAERYARDGWAVCIGDIHEARSAELVAKLQAAGAKAHFIPCDVTKISQIQAAADWLLAHWGGVDTVINNAGVAVSGAISEVTMEDWEWAVNINLLGVVRGCKVFTPMFRKQGHGQFINIASAAGLAHLPEMSPYNSSKAAVVALSETLRLELKPFGIQVSVVCPTFFQTNLVENFRTTQPDGRRLMDALVTKSKITAESIAHYVVQKARKNRFLILPNLDGRSVVVLRRLLPQRLFFSVVLLVEKQNNKSLPPIR